MKETFKVGTLKACNEATRFIGDDCAKILELIAIEGPRWVPYTRIEEVYYGVKIPPTVTAETPKEG